jgi:hypothetical protein
VLDVSPRIEAGTFVIVTGLLMWTSSLLIG